MFAANALVTPGIPVQLVGPNPRRTRLIVSNDATDALFIGPTEAAVANLQAIRIPKELGTMVLRIEDWGKMLIEPWWAFYPTTGASLAWVEVETMRT